MTAEKRLNEHHAPSEVWVTHYALDTSEPERQWLDYVSTKPWPADYKAQITERAANTRFVRADIPAVLAQAKGAKPLDLSDDLRGQLWQIVLKMTACDDDGCGQNNCSCMARYANILAALEPQPDPRDAVIARLVEALEGYKSRSRRTPFDLAVSSDTALAAAKAVQP